MDAVWAYCGHIRFQLKSVRCVQEVDEVWASCKSGVVEAIWVCTPVCRSDMCNVTKSIKFYRLLYGMFADGEDR